MTLHEYQKQAQRTCPSLGSEEKDILHMRLGVFTETGEFLDQMKKNIAYGRQLDLVNLQEEIGDISFYVVNEARMMGYNIGEGELTFSDEEDEKQLSVDEQCWSLMGWCTEFQAGAVLSGFGYDEFLYMLYRFAKACGFDYWEILDKNVKKLQLRYPDKFDKDLAINRDVKAERLILEA